MLCVLGLWACTPDRSGDSVWSEGTAWTEPLPTTGRPEAVDISRDGRYVVFSSAVSGGTHYPRPHGADVFIFDRATATGERLSVDRQGREADGPSRNPRVSDDGRWVAFDSAASNLVAGDSNGVEDVFVRDRQEHLTTRISANDGEEGNGQSHLLALSADGQVVLFESSAANLALGSVPPNIMLHDRRLGTTRLVSVNDSGNAINASQPSLSANGRLVAFASGDLAIGGDSRGLSQVFVRDLRSAAVEPCSVAADGGTAKDTSASPSLSADGRWVVFVSDADNLVARDRNGCADVFLRDRERGTTERVSLDSRGRELSGPSGHPSLSDDGRYVVFETTAPELAGAGSRSQQQAVVCVRDRNVDATLLVSAAADGSAGRGMLSTLAGSGHAVAFLATGLLPGDSARGAVYLRVPGLTGALRGKQPPAGTAADDLFLAHPSADAAAPPDAAAAADSAPRIPRGAIEEGRLDPDEVYIFGPVGERSPYYGWVHPSEPQRILAGTTFRPRHLGIRPRDGRMLYTTDAPEVRQVGPDRLLFDAGSREWFVSQFNLWQPATKTWVELRDAQDPTANDAVAARSVNPDCGGWRFFIEPTTSEVVVGCRGAQQGYRTPSGQPVDTGGNGLIALGGKGLKLTKRGSALIVVDRKGAQHPVLGLPAGASALAVRSFGAAGFRACIKVQPVGRLEQWTIDERGNASLVGSYAPPPAGASLLDTAALDGRGDLWVTCVVNHCDGLVRLPVAPGTAQVEYTNCSAPAQPTTPFIWMERLVTGP